MNTNQCFEYLVKEIHTVVLSTVDQDNHPITCAIDIMDFDENNLYFLTAKGKSLYKRLKENPHIAFTGIQGKDTLSSIAVSVQGEVREIGADFIAHLFEINPYMESIYPTVQSRSALTVFQIHKGTGEYFDLSKQPIERYRFSFGSSTQISHGYVVNNQCIGCKLCLSKCPQQCVDVSSIPAVIQQEHCLHCGNCYEICPARAIEWR